ncbi:M56 family metallopeptidase [uncultured Robinsoniella sp.]|uniref:M56 family metallopeptidase n=1 Tax=uncultured Robinsoniella sp. TaxID=904190 RepID=UPI00374ED128
MNVLQLSISGGLLIIGIMVVRALSINRISKKFFVLLWDIVLLRLLFPFTVTFQFITTNLFTSVPKQIDQVIQQRVADLPIIKGTSGTYLPAGAGVSQQENIPVFQIIWLSGLIALSLFFIIAYYRDYRKLREALPIKHNIFLDHWMKEKQLKRKVVILLSDRVNTPVTYGIFSPKIILPRTMDLTDHKALKFVLEHELVHIKCHDNLWKIVALAALCIHWFNPVVWIMQILFNRDLELSCDEKVITSVGAEQRQEYALTLINLAGNKSGISFLHSSFGKNVIKERIVSIMKYKKTSIISIICVIVLITAVSVFWFISPGNDQIPASASKNDKHTEEAQTTSDSQKETGSKSDLSQVENQKKIIAPAADMKSKESERQNQKTTDSEKKSGNENKTPKTQPIETEAITEAAKETNKTVPPETSTSSGFVTKIEGSTMYLQEEGHGDSKVAYELINAVINIPDGVRMNQTVEVHYYTKDGKNVATEVNGDGTGTKPIDTGDYFSGSYELEKDGMTIKLSISSYTDLYTSARGNVMGTIINNDGTESGFYGELIMTDTVNQYDVTTDSGLSCSFVFSGDTLNISSSPDTISGAYTKTSAYRPS